MSVCNHYFVAGHCLHCDAPDPYYRPMPLSEKIMMALILSIIAVAVWVSVSLK